LNGEYDSICTFRFTEALEVHNFPLPQEADRIADIRVFDDPQDIIVSASGLLFCGHIFYQIGNGVSLYLELAGVKRNAAGCHGPNACGMVDIIRTKAGGFNFFHRQVSGQLVYNRSDHLHVPQFLRTYIGNKNVAVAKNADKPCGDGLLIHTIMTNEKVLKYRVGYNETPFDVLPVTKQGETERIINLYIAA